MQSRKKEHQEARPLKVLVPLIKQDLDAAERAGIPHYVKAGEKLIEAKGQLAHGQFTPWVTENLGITPRLARHYMALAEHVQNGNAFPVSLREFIRQTAKPKPTPAEKKSARSGSNFAKP
jgi:hypothetical protein